MNLNEGARRLALLLGAVGAIVGGFASYLQLQSTMRQRADYLRSMQQEKLPPVHFDPNAPYQDVTPPSPTKKSAVKPDQAPAIDYDALAAQARAQNPAPATDDPFAAYQKPLATKAGGAKRYQPKPAQDDGWTVVSERPADSTGSEPLVPRDLFANKQPPGAWSYTLIGILPVLGFLLPWGAVRAIVWVVAGFVAGPK